MTSERIRALLGSYEPLALAAGGARPAAVLVPLWQKTPDAGVEIVLTRRSDQIADHPGQVAFPGGRVELTDESPAHAALREAEEELGIPPPRVELIGRLDDMVTITGFHIVPVVGWIAGPLTLRPDPVEVARAFAVPLAELLRRQRWERRLHSFRGNELWSWHFPYDGEDVWGVTGTMLRFFVELLWRAGIVL